MVKKCRFWVPVVQDIPACSLFTGELNITAMNASCSQPAANTFGSFFFIFFICIDLLAKLKDRRYVSRPYRSSADLAHCLRKEISQMHRKMKSSDAMT